MFQLTDSLTPTSAVPLPPLKKFKVHVALYDRRWEFRHIIFQQVEPLAQNANWDDNRFRHFNLSHSFLLIVSGFPFLILSIDISAKIKSRRTIFSRLHKLECTSEVSGLCSRPWLCLKMNNSLDERRKTSIKIGLEWICYCESQHTVGNLWCFSGGSRSAAAGLQLLSSFVLRSKSHFSEARAVAALLRALWNFKTNFIRQRRARGRHAAGAPLRGEKGIIGDYVPLSSSTFSSPQHLLSLLTSFQHRRSFHPQISIFTTLIPWWHGLF